MPLTSIKLKPGIVSVQTPTLNELGWSAGSNIRFFEGLPQKDAGFVNILTDAALGPIRALKAWTDLDQVNVLGIGGNNKLAVWTGSIETDISPVGLTPTDIVTLDNWGDLLVACYANGPLYVWNPEGVGPATNIATAPQVNFLTFVAPQQQQLIVGGTVNSATNMFDPMLLRWSDVGDYTDFTPTVSNQAGSFRLAIGSAIRAGMALPGSNLIWTDQALYSMQYLQPPLVWGFQLLGQNCGAVGPHAIGVLGGQIFWKGQNQFFTLGPSGPEIIPCPVWDLVFPNASPMTAFVACETDSYYGEVGWSVEQNDGSFIFARVQVQTGAWTASSYHHHTAWIDQNVFGAPFGGHENGIVDQHDVGYDANGVAAPWSLTSGIMMISEGDEVTFMRDLLPDFATQGTSPKISWTISFYDYPNKAPRVHGPYTTTQATQLIHPRGRGRGVQFQISGDDVGTFARLGNLRFRGNADGRR